MFRLSILQTFLLLLNGQAPASFLFILGLFKQTILFLKQINVKKCPNIQTHDLMYMSCHP